MARTDIHRASQLDPARYTLVIYYALPGSDLGDRGYGVCCPEQHVGDYCCVRRLSDRAVVFANHGGLGKCTICGASFRFGAVWRHENGEHIHVGHECAAVYSLLSADQARELAADRKRRRALARKFGKLEASKQVVLQMHPGLAEALQCDHRIVRDIAGRFEQTGRLSDKQAALVLKLATEIKNTPAKPVERLVPAPVDGSRKTITGTIVSCKLRDGDYGSTYKATIKVRTDDGGTWLVWGTCPAAVVDSVPNGYGVRQLTGATVELTAAMKPGREPHFALMSRAHGKVIAWPASTEVQNEVRALANTSAE